VLIVAAIALLAWLMYGPGGSVPTDAGSQRVIVLPYVNQTGNPELDPIGRMAAEWITEGLARTGEVQVIPNLMVLERMAILEREEGGYESGVSVRPLAATLDASIAVTGSYYVQGSDLELHSAITDLESERSLGTVEPTRALLAIPGEAIEAAREGVMGVLATRLRRGTAWEVPSSVQPPTYQAFQHYARGNELWLQERYDEAAHWFTQAYEADTTFLRSLMTAGAAHGQAGHPAKSDSLIQFILPRRAELAPYDRFRLDYGAANNRGDILTKLRAARAAVELVPSGTVRLALVRTLIEVNRPAESLENLEAVLPDLLSVAPGWYPIWDTRTELHHLLGDHERELQLAREGREHATNSLRFMVLEGRALAALGRIDELLEVVTEITSAPEEPGTNAGRSLRELAEELRAHGHLAEATELIEKALTWLNHAPPDRSGSPAGMELLGRLHYQAEKWEEAGEVFQALLDSGVENSTTLGLRGVSAARLGDTTVAEEASARLAELDKPFSYGSSSLWRARIHSVLGNYDEAMGLLRRAFGEGAGLGVWAHKDMHLEMLRGHPPFEEYLRPEG
jgi:tetratricopeptide (TPR) repeat protein